MREELSAPRPRSVGWSTSIDVLPLDTVVECRDGYLVVRSPGNPSHYWGNLLIFDDAPHDRDGRPRHPAPGEAHEAVEALAAVDLEVGEGEPVGPLGASGAGKPTQVEIAGGLSGRLAAERRSARPGRGRVGARLI